MKTATLGLLICLLLAGCSTIVAVADVTASTVVYTGKAIVGAVTP